MADFHDAAIGWEIFQTRGGDVSIVQLNQALKALGREPIAPRTYNHYRKLQRLGYEEYVSINRLDIRHANDSIFDLSDRSRYTDRVIGTPGTLVVPRRDTLERFTGTVVRVSEGFASIRVAPSPEAREVARATKYDRGVLVFDEVGVERAVRIVEALDRADELELLLEFRSLLETEVVLGRSPFRERSSRLTLNLGGDASLYELVSAVHTTFDLFESVRGFLDAAVSTSTTEPVPTLGSPRVRRLEFSNPLELILITTGAVVVGVSFVVAKVAGAVSASANARRDVQAIAHDANEEQRRQELHDVSVRSMQLDNVKKVIEVDELLSHVRPELAEVLGGEILELNRATRSRMEAMKDQAIEAAAELTELSESSVKFDQT